MLAKVGILARRMYPTNWRQFMKIYEDGTSENYGLLVNTHPQSNPDMRLMANILPHQQTIAYKLKKYRSEKLSLPLYSNMDDIRRNWPLVLFIYKNHSRTVLDCILCDLTEKQTISLLELALNFYRGNVKISNHCKTKLCVHKTIIIECSKGVSKSSLIEKSEVLLLLIKASYVYT